jgi:hypothetical protein
MAAHVLIDRSTGEDPFDNPARHRRKKREKEREGGEFESAQHTGSSGVSIGEPAALMQMSE